MQYGSSGRRSLGFNMVLQGASLSNLIVFGSLLVLVGFVHESRAEDHVEPVGGNGPYDCMHLMLRGAKQIMKVLSKCGKEVKANCTSNKEFGEKISCVMKCVMHKVNMLTPDYLVTDESLMRLMQKFLPDQFLIHEVHSFLATNCAQAAAKIDPNEEKCLSYGDYVLCMQQGFEKFMNTSPVCIKRKKKNPDGEDE